VSRRDLLAGSTTVVGVAALAGCGGPGRGPASGVAGGEELPVTPPEDLMREHGVLKRVLLIYREGISRLQGGAPSPAQALNAGAGIIRSFIEDYHEHLEEQFVFPRLEQATKSVEITATLGVLRTQHQRGRDVTDRVLAGTAGSAPSDRSAREALVAAMSAFIRMYEPHEAREDTVIFPALRDALPARELREMAETFEDEEHRRFGQAGFGGVVDRVADIEKSLGIYDLSQFTAT